MLHALRFAGALALAVALSPSASAQGLDCRNLPASAGLPPAECLHDTVPGEGALRSSTGSHFGYEAFADQYVRFAPGFTVVGPASTTDFVNAADFRDYDSSTWYALDYAGNAYTVNATTGAETALGAVTPIVQWSDLAWDYTTSRFYAIASDCATGTRLYTVDFSTRTATLVGTGTSAPCGVGLAIHPFTGVAYVHDVVSDAIYTMNKATGATTLVGPTGFDANYAQSMDFDNGNGTLYLYAFNSVTFTAELRTVNLSTGATTFVGPIGSGTREITAGSSETDGIAVDCFYLYLLAADLSYDAGTRRLTVQATVYNEWIAPRAARLDLDYARDGGDPQGTRILGSGTLPAGATVSRTLTLHVPRNTPPGSYDFVLWLRDPGTGVACDAYSETLTISSPRLGAVEGGALFNAEAAADLTPSASAVTGTAAVSPNPFARQTQIAYAVPEAAEVRLAVYDLLGREVAVLVDGRQEAGPHTATFDARGLAAGTYVYRLSVGGDVQTGRMTLTR